MILFAGIPSPDQVVASSTIAACGFQWQQSLEVLAQFAERRLRGTLLSHTPAVRACGDAFQWSWGVQLLGELQKQAVRRDRICSTTAIKACSGEDETATWSQGLVLFHELQGADVVAYSAVMSVCGRARQWQRSLTLLGELKPGLRADSTTFSTAISACKEQWQHAVHLLSDYLSSGMRLDLVTLNAAVSALATGAQWQRAIAFQVRLDDLRMQKDIATCNASLSACERSCRWEVALALTVQAGLQLSIMSYNLLASACAKAQEWIVALDLLADLEGNAITDGVAINALSRGLLWQDALDLLMTMPVLNVVASGTLLNALQQAALWPQGLSLLRSMPKPSLACYDYVLMACPRPLAFQLLLESRDLRTAGSYLWGLAATGARPEVIHDACVAGLWELRGKARQVATLWWATAQLGASNAEFQRLLTAQARAVDANRCEPLGNLLAFC